MGSVTGVITSTRGICNSMPPGACADSTTRPSNEITVSDCNSCAIKGNRSSSFSVTDCIVPQPSRSTMKFTPPNPANRMQTTPGAKFVDQCVPSRQPFEPVPSSLPFRISRVIIHSLLYFLRSWMRISHSYGSEEYIFNAPSALCPNAKSPRPQGDEGLISHIVVPPPFAYQLPGYALYRFVRRKVYKIDHQGFSLDSQFGIVLMPD